jgi:hypothetical protein
MQKSQTSNPWSETPDSYASKAAARFDLRRLIFYAKLFYLLPSSGQSIEYPSPRYQKHTKFAESTSAETCQSRDDATDALSFGNRQRQRQRERCS